MGMHNTSMIHLAGKRAWPQVIEDNYYRIHSLSHDNNRQQTKNSVGYKETGSTFFICFALSVSFACKESLNSSWPHEYNDFSN